jgi:hypothetical protein
MSLKSELTEVYQDLDLEHIIDRRVALLLAIFGAMIIIYGILMIYHGHVTDIGMGSFDPTFEYQVPVGSPEIGIRPDGTVGSINPYGRISSV